MDRQGPGRALGHRAVRGRKGRLVGRSILVNVAIVGGEQHVDVGIAPAAVLASSDDNEAAVGVALVDQMMSDARTLRPCGNVAGAEHRAPVVLDEHGFP